MSTSSIVEVTRHDEGGYTAIDEETGARGEGTTRAGALEDLASNLQNEEFAVEESTPSLSEELWNGSRRARRSSTAAIT